MHHTLSEMALDWERGTLRADEKIAPGAIKVSSLGTLMRNT